MAIRIACDGKMPPQLQSKAAALVQRTSASTRELNVLRKLNPMPKSPVLPRAEYLGPDVGPVDNIFREEQPEVHKNKQEEPIPNQRANQRETGWSPVLERPAKPFVRAVGSTFVTNAFPDQPEPPYQTQTPSRTHRRTRKPTRHGEVLPKSHGSNPNA